ncbi:hypothetical protein BDR07DRAFT_1380756 [Suillus spraguei]|nr:hypothetical protein BDR07DRAFT_1380756 [Suillus spraguei]
MLLLMVSTLSLMRALLLGISVGMGSWWVGYELAHGDPPSTHDPHSGLVGIIAPGPEEWYKLKLFKLHQMVSKRQPKPTEKAKAYLQAIKKTLKSKSPVAAPSDSEDSLVQPISKSAPTTNKNIQTVICSKEEEDALYSDADIIEIPTPKSQSAVPTIIETLWACLNLISPAARGMSSPHRKGCLDYQMNNSNFCKMIHMKRTLCQKYKLVKNGITKTSEMIAQSRRISDPVVMDLYEINIKKAPSKKEIKLRLLEAGNAHNAAPSRRSVAIEETQIALLIKVQRIGRQSTETQRLDITRQYILDDLNDDPADFTKTSDVWTNSPELTIIPLPSNLGVDQCRHCMAEDLILLEMSLHEGQANDALHNLRIHLCNKAILFRTTVRQAKSQALKTQVWSQVTSVQQAVSLHASIYTKTRKQMIQLEPGQDQLQKYKPLLHEQLKISTAVGNPNA